MAAAAAVAGAGMVGRLGWGRVAGHGWALVHGVVIKSNFYIVLEMYMAQHGPKNREQGQTQC